MPDVGIPATRRWSASTKEPKPPPTLVIGVSTSGMPASASISSVHSGVSRSRGVRSPAAPCWSVLTSQPSPP